MKYLAFLLALIASTSGGWGCTSQVIEMDSKWSASEDAATDGEGSAELLDSCAGVACGPGVLCAEGEPCPPCECCPCLEDSPEVCDENYPNSIWLCDDGCYQLINCGENQYCTWETSGEAECRELDFEEDGICNPPFEFDPDCYECDSCEIPYVSYCDFGFGNDAFTSCEYDQFNRLCWIRQQCEPGEECAQGYKTNQAQCGRIDQDSFTFDCDTLGCTGAAPYCGMPGTGPGGWEDDCGPCGCCYASEESDLCLLQGEGSVRLRNRHDNDDDDGFEEACFDWDPCPPNKICQLDDDGEARCN